MNPSINTARRRRPAAFGGLEKLEGRQLFAGGNWLPPTLTPPPDNAGGTPATAAVVSLQTMVRKTVRDHLPSSADADWYKVRLEKGDFLAADLDRTPNGSALSATLSITDARNNRVSFTKMYTEPENGMISSDPAIGFWAPAAGDYFVQVRTTATTTSYARSYDLHLERVGLDVNKSNATLAEDGAFRTWLSANGETLHVAGPSGYGFSLRGAWTTTTNSGEVTYATQGTMWLSTPFLASSIGDIALQPSSGGFSVKANTVGGWRGLGRFAGTDGSFGLSLAPIAGKIKQAVGMDVSSVSVMDKWTIKTGEQIRNGSATPIKQVLSGVPYLMYGAMGKVTARLGDITVAETEQSSTVLIAEPADPMLYVKYKKFAGAASLNRRIPFNNTVSPPTHDGVNALTPHYGHLFGDGEVQVTIVGIPFNFYRDTTVDLDSNNDGQLIGGITDPTDVFRSGAALGAALGDVNIGSNDKVDVGYDFAGYDVRATLGTSSTLYSGKAGGVWFKGESHTPTLDLFSGTPLADFETGARTKLSGYVKRGGHFSVTNESNYSIYGLQSDAKLTISAQGTIPSTRIQMIGRLDTPIGASAAFSATVGLNGNFVCNGELNFHIGNSDNYIRGEADFTLAKTGSQLKFRADGELTGQLKISGVARIKGTVDGHLELIYSPSGLQYDTGFDFDGRFDVWEPIFGNWQKVTDVNGSFSISNDRLRIGFQGSSFSLAI